MSNNDWPALRSQLKSEGKTFFYDEDGERLMTLPRLRRKFDAKPRKRLKREEIEVLLIMAERWAAARK